MKGNSDLSILLLQNTTSQIFALVTSEFKNIYNDLSDSSPGFKLSREKFSVFSQVTKLLNQIKLSFAPSQYIEIYKETLSTKMKYQSELYKQMKSRYEEVKSKEKFF